MQPTDNLAYSVKGAAGVIGYSPAKAWQEIREGKLRAVRAGGRTLVLRRDVEAYLDALEPVTDAPAPAVA